jgi:hypothetical protein
MDYPLVNRGHKQLVGKIAKMTFLTFREKYAQLFGIMLIQLVGGCILLFQP